MPKYSRTVSCKFCDWSRPLFWKKNGRLIRGFDRLRKHVEDEHEEQFIAITEWARGDEENRACSK